MSLAASGQIAHPVTRRGAEFLLTSQRQDGSWPIDTNLATWLTTLATNALATCRGNPLSSAAKAAIRSWLLNQQYRSIHPYTQAAPGGWAWTDLPGGVPDADDTAGALLALKNLGAIDGRSMDAAVAGLRWLLNVQNRDGGLPTFCCGWGKLAFDRSSADLTAHAIRAWLAWKNEVPTAISVRLDKAIRRAVQFLCRNQQTDGYWLPLWFGNQHRTDESNPVHGTARVLTALAECVRQRIDIARPALRRGLQWLLETQNPDGAWGGGAQTPPSLEETALAVEALAACLNEPDSLLEKPPQALDAAARGAQWLAARVASGAFRQPAPIGFYFSRLWYYEKLYPLIFTVGALGAYRSSILKTAVGIAGKDANN
jgi:squalene-hopene/tetraprenyl-beta-curcumene cyclase